MAEVWKPIPGYEGRYEVSDAGRVRSVDRLITYADGRKRRYPGILRKLHPVRKPDGQHYWTVRLTKKGANHQVHQLVAEAFLGARPDGYVTRHLDGNGLNNCLANLTYGTNGQNQIDIYSYGGKPGLGKLSPEDAAYICQLHDEGLSYREIMAHSPVSKSTVARVVKGQFDWAKRGLV